MTQAATDAVPARIPRPWLSPLNQRRLQNFKANRRGYWSLWIFLVLFVLSLFSELIANDRPIIVSYKGEILFPVLVAYPEEKFGGFYAVTDYRDPVIQDEINGNGWMIWPPVRYSYQTVNNAIPETPPGGSSTVRGSHEPGSPQVALSVSDTGRGMPPHIRERLFSARAVSTKKGGTGLGTKIVKDVVDAHQGTIWVESEQGIGTSFHLQLPLDPTRPVNKKAS